MHDVRFEDLVRQSLRDDAAGLPFTLSAESLERRLAERRSRTRSRSTRWLLVAAAAAALAGAAAIVGSQLTRIDPPPPDPTVTLPVPGDMLGGYADATLILEDSVGPADAPVDALSSAAPNASPTPIEIGRIQLTGPFVLTVACLGSGEIRVEVQTPSIGVPYTQAVGPCDGSTIVSEYLAVPIDPASDGDLVSVIVDPGASWRVAVGEFPAELLTAPQFESVALTSGWNLLSNTGPTLLSSASRMAGVGTATPAEATRIGAFVECHGDGAISVSAGTAAATTIDCRTSGTRRLEYPVTGGEALDLRITGDGNRLWVRAIVESDAGIATIYPVAPPLPDDVAAAPYVVADPNVVGLGTIGSNEQTILELAGGRPGRPSGDLLPVAFHRESAGAELALVSIAGGEIVRTLVQAPAPNFIFDSWADSTHGAVIYAMATETGIEFHRVAIDGSDDRVVAMVEPDPTGVTAELALDHAMFVVDACHAGSGCARTIVDPATGASERTERAGAPVCAIFGITGGTLVGSTRPLCTDDAAATDVVAIPLDGGDAIVLVEDIDRAAFVGATVVATTDGTKLVLAGPVGPDAIAWDVLDIATLETSVVESGEGEPPLSIAIDVPLPGGWVLLTGGGLGDFPWQRAIDRPAPVIVNLVTGERIELVNLPHWTGTLSVSP